MLIGMQILYDAAQGDPAPRIDPIRIIDGLIGGIGFLGAGSIIRSGGTIQGITTGTMIWTAGAVGIACGVGNLALAVLITALVLIIVVAVDRFEHRVLKHNKVE